MLLKSGGTSGQRQSRPARRPSPLNLRKVAPPTELLPGPQSDCASAVTAAACRYTWTFDLRGGQRTYAPACGAGGRVFESLRPDHIQRLTAARAAVCLRNLGLPKFVFLRSATVGILPGLEMQKKPASVAHSDGARSACAGFEALARIGSKDVEWAAVILAGFAVENALKAFVASRGGNPRQHGHDLVALWGQARALGGPLHPMSQNPPPWCVELSTLTAATPFEARYHGAHGNQSPPIATMLREIPQLVAAACT